MRLTIQSEELKTVLGLVKALCDCGGSKVATNAICTIEANPQTHDVTLDFALNGAFLSYRFREATVGEFEQDRFDRNGTLKRTIDLAAFASLRYPDKTISLMLDTHNKTLGFTSGRLKGKLVTTNASLDAETEDLKHVRTAIQTTHTFNVRDFLRGLACHGYGTHHNALEAAKRAVRIYTEQNRLKFFSNDAIVTSIVDIENSILANQPFDAWVLPKPLKTVLNGLPDEKGTFEIGVTKEFWRVTQLGIDVWYPCIVRAKSPRFEEKLAAIDASDPFRFVLPLSGFESALKEIAPFVTDGALVGKDDTPLLRFVVENGRVSLKVDTAKSQDVELVLNVLEGARLPERDELVLNYRYMVDFLASLKTLCVKKDDPIVLLQWWRYLDDASPAKGKMVELALGANRYFIVRLKKR